MVETVSHLLPNFEAMSPLNPQVQVLQLSDWFWLAMMLIMIIALTCLFYYFMQYQKNVRHIEKLLRGQSREDLAWKRQEILDKAEKTGTKAGKLWREFDESLVFSPDKDKLFNTLDADHFFNGKSLAYGLTSSRLLAATPTFLTAIGVLGTFMGLTIGLRGLQVNTDDIDTLRVGIASMINGAAIAFLTSVWGIGLSLLLNVIEKLVERSALKRINNLQHEIDFLYPRMPAEHSLVQIAESSMASKEALQELHERIGDRLQETVSGMSEAMQQAVADSMNNIMAPAIQALVDNASNQSTEVLENLVTNFMDGVKSAGNEQSKALGSAAEEVNSAVTSMTSKMDELFSTLTEQHKQSNTQIEASTRDFAEQLHQHRQYSDEQQSILAQNFESFMQRMTETIDRQHQIASENDEKRQKAYENDLKMFAEQQQKAIEQQMELMAEREETRLTSFTDQQHALEERFSGLIEKLVTEQQELMRQVGEASSKANQHLVNISSQYESLSTALNGVATSAESSSQNMANSSAQLGALSSNLKKVTSILDERINLATESFAQISDRNGELFEKFGDHARTLDTMQQVLSSTAEHLDSAAKSANEGFSELGKHQEEFLHRIRDEFTHLGDVLKEQVERIEKQAEEWLQAYSQEVNSQVSDRMEEWNRNTLSFADQMQRTVTAINGIVDDLERR